MTDKSGHFDDAGQVVGYPSTMPIRARFVPELPLAGTNKIDRKTLVEHAAAPYARDQRRL